MNTFTINKTKQWLKTSKQPFAIIFFNLAKAILHFEFPVPRFIVLPLYSSFIFTRSLLASCFRVIWWTPLFKGRLNKYGRRLYLYGGLPYISGPLQIKIGSNCRVSGQTTFTGRSCSSDLPLLSIGHNVDIGWMTSIAVGTRVSIGDNVRIAGRALLAGYPGHPIDPVARAAGAPETDDQVGDIILEKDVWLATGVSVMAGVRIGEGTIVAAGSVVTHDLPAGILAAGIPAKKIRALEFSSTVRGDEL